MRRDRRPTYVRMLRLRRLKPPGWLNFVLLEGSVLFGLLLAFTRENPHLKEASYTVRWNGR